MEKWARRMYVSSSENSAALSLDVDDAISGMAPLVHASQHAPGGSDPLSGYFYTVLSSIAGINAKTVALTTLYTVPAGKSLVPAAFQFRVTALTGAKTIQASLQVGGNSATYNDLVGSITPTIAVSGTYTRIQSLTQGPVYGAGSVIKLNIIVGSGATTETWAVDLIGYLV
jgi:type IV secretory pathway VirB2 component (pilin)